MHSLNLPNPRGSAFENVQPATRSVHLDALYATISIVMPMAGISFEPGLQNFFSTPAENMHGPQICELGSGIQ